MKKLATILLVLLLHVTGVSSQEICLVVSDKPLNEVLRNLSVEISFDDAALSKYNISVKKTFKDAEEALGFLLQDKPFAVKRIEGVYVITPSAIHEPDERAESVKKHFTFSGIVKEAGTGERIPYTYIITPAGTLLCDETGFFSLKAENSESIRAQVQCLGYEPQGFYLSPGFCEITVQPKTFAINEVVIRSVPSSMIVQSGKTSGELRINHQVARYIPGNVDNSVFNLMRMMPGVRASGEPSDDFIVWGSHLGESQIKYDGYTLFGIKNYNDHIGPVNPYMVKDIQLSKAGYGAAEGGRIGAVAKITGTHGNFDSPSVKASLSNYTVNLYASVPLSSKLNVAAAYRQTFYNLYQSEQVNPDVGEGKGNGNGRQNLSEVYVKPEYDFKDLTIKLSGKADKHDSYYISLYGGDDRFKFSVKQPDRDDAQAAEKSKQYGGAASYNRVWAGGSKTCFIAAYSKQESVLNNLTLTSSGNTPAHIDVSYLDNDVREFSVKLDQDFNLGSRNNIRFGGEWKQYKVKLNEENNELNAPAFYATDRIMLGKLSLEAGVRTDILPKGKVHVQPRFSGRYELSDRLTATASWGMYNQFLTCTPFLYNDNTWQTVWSVADSIRLKAMHTVGGIAYNRAGLLVSLEGYRKKTKNGYYFLDNTVYNLNNTMYGGDLYVKKEIKKHTLYGSYSVISLKEPRNEFSREVKIGGIGAFDPFYFSFSYVYGNGFYYISTAGHGHGHGQPQGEGGKNGTHGHSDSSGKSYNRFDISASYKKQFKNWRLQTGISLLNVFDTRNIKYGYQLSDQNNITNIYTKATPFTPAVYIEIVL